MQDLPPPRLSLSLSWPSARPHPRENRSSSASRARADGRYIQTKQCRSRCVSAPIIIVSAVRTSTLYTYISIPFYILYLDPLILEMARRWYLHSPWWPPPCESPQASFALVCSSGAPIADRSGSSRDRVCRAEGKPPPQQQLRLPRPLRTRCSRCSQACC